MPPPRERSEAASAVAVPKPVAKAVKGGVPQKACPKGGHVALMAKEIHAKGPGQVVQQPPIGDPTYGMCTVIGADGKTINEPARGLADQPKPKEGAVVPRPVHCHTACLMSPGMRWISGLPKST